MSISSLGDDMIPPAPNEPAPLDAATDSTVSTPVSDSSVAQQSPSPGTPITETSTDGTNTLTAATVVVTQDDPPKPSTTNESVTPSESSSPVPSTVATTETESTPDANGVSIASPTASTPTALTPSPQSVTQNSSSETSTTSTPSSVSPNLSEFDQITNMLLNSIGDIGVSQHMKIMIYGDPGSRKTSWLGQIPNNLIWDMEDGVVSIKSAAIVSGIPTAPGVQVVPFKSMFQGTEIVKRLSANVTGFDKFDVFSVDTISDVAKRELMRITREAYAKQPLSRKEFTPDTPEYVEVNNQLAEFVRDLRDMPKDLIITSHAKTVEPKNKPAKTYPDFSESLANKLEAMMDIVAYAEKREMNGEEHIVWTVSSTQGVHAKTRIPLPAEIIDPTYAQIRAIWEQVLNS